MKSSNGCRVLKYCVLCIARILRIGWILLPFAKKQTKNFYKQHIIREFGIVGIAPIKTGFVGYITSRCALKQEDESKIVNTDIANICNMGNTPAAALSATIPLDTAAVDEQKKRAKQFWNDSSYNEDLKEKINDDVMNHLDQGLVLPIFHTTNVCFYRIRVWARRI